MVVYFFQTRIFGAYSPSMFVLWVYVGFGASWRGGILCESCSFVNSSALGDHKYMFGRTLILMFGRKYGIMFGRTLFEYCLEGHFS